MHNHWQWKIGVPAPKSVVVVQLCSVWTAWSTGIVAYLHNFNHFKRMRLLSFSRLCFRPTHKTHNHRITKHSIVFHRRRRILFFFSVSFFCGLQKWLDFVCSFIRSVGRSCIACAVCVVSVLLLLQLLHKTLFNSEFTLWFVDCMKMTMSASAVIQIYMPIWFWVSVVFCLRVFSFFLSVSINLKNIRKNATGRPACLHCMCVVILLFLQQQMLFSAADTTT